MKAKEIIKIAILLFSPVVVPAQSQLTQLDSLQLVLNNATNDTMRMDAYWHIAGYYAEINRDSSLLYCRQSLSVAQKLKLKLAEANILEGIGFILTNIGNYPEALESLYQALKIVEDPANEKTIPNLSEGQSPKKVRLNLLGDIHLNMGHLYGATGNNYKKASEYIIAIKLADSVQNTALTMNATMNLGHAYLKLNKLDSALLYEQRAISMISNGTSRNEKYDGWAFELLGRIYQAKGDYGLSRDAYQKAITISKERNNLSGLARALNFIGGFYHTIKKPDSSLLYAREALSTAKTVGLPLEIRNAYKLLSDTYSEQKNNDSTLTYLKLYTLLNDSLNRVEKENLLAYQNIGFEEQLRVKKLEEEKIQTRTKIRIYGMLAGLIAFLVIGLILFRNYRHKQKANEVLESALANLKSTQSQLIQSEKMASLGELTAGIAHEIQNPLNFVNNFSEVNTELLDELKQEAEKGNLDDVKSIAEDIRDNNQKIAFHGKRADSIVKGMLQHSRTSTGKKEATDINALADEFLRLSYHGLRAKDKSFNAAMETNFDYTIEKVRIVPQDVGRVLLNLFNNAFYSVNEKKKELNGLYEPKVFVSTEKKGNKIEIIVKDNGNGISQKVIDKIYQPFFTTKPTGEGTGLGLSLSYDIITKGHGGELKVETEEGEFALFRIILPAIE